LLTFLPKVTSEARPITPLAAARNEAFASLAIISKDLLPRSAELAASQRRLPTEITSP
jgi:hypothetical protein